MLMTAEDVVADLAGDRRRGACGPSGWPARWPGDDGTRTAYDALVRAALPG